MLLEQALITMCHKRFFLCHEYSYYKNFMHVKVVCEHAAYFVSMPRVYGKAASTRDVNSCCSCINDEQETSTWHAFQGCIRDRRHTAFALANLHHLIRMVLLSNDIIMLKTHNEATLHLFFFHLLTRKLHKLTCLKTA